MGGSIAYTYAAVHPEDVSRLVIEDSAPRPRTTPVRGCSRCRRPSSPHAKRWPRACARRIPYDARGVLEQRVDVYYVQRPDGTWGYRADVAGVRGALASQPGYEKLWQHVRASSARRW